MTKKFIQFVSGKKGGFGADVPVKKLTEKEINKLEKLPDLEMNLHLESSLIQKIAEIPGIGLKASILYPHLIQFARVSKDDLQKLPGIHDFDDFEGITRVSKDDLQKIPGIGEKLAERIVSFIPDLKKHILEMESKTIAEKDYSFEKECILEEATDLTRRFFEEVCGLPEDHDVSVEVETGEVKCALCGKTFTDLETEHLEISVDKARELGIPEESIQKSIDDEVRFAVGESPEFELDEIIKIVQERGTIFITVCSNCSKNL